MYSSVLDGEIEKIDVSDDSEDEKRKKPKPRLVSRKRSRSRSRSPKRRGGKKTEEDEIAEANELRAKLGLAPLER